MRKSEYNKTLSAAVQSLGVKNVTPAWTDVKALVPRSEVTSASDVKALVKQNKGQILALFADQPAPKARKKAPEGTLRRAIQDYQPKAKTAVFVKADGTEVSCTPAQKAAWEAGRERFAATKATQAPSGDVKAKAVRELVSRIDDPQVVEALVSLLKG